MKVTTIMTTADMAMREDPEYLKYQKDFRKILMNSKMLLLERGLNFYIEIWVEM